ncbi:hypothetical protein BT93_F1686 [Corymbia citriodora subsp. variegata]|nr:hypothetical protein BT93_F1686 [Corymbia citriodora subsp. variegata]
MASSSSKPRRNYHVFLSFRGSDVRNNFLGHLYIALDQTGIYTYIDSEELKKGEQISPMLMKAIEESRIAIVPFSENYASSRWCLEEVAKIMECKAQRDLIVLPIFYKVEPREIRGQRKSYGRAMAAHQSKFGKDSEIVKRWKKALFEADEAKLIKRIVKEISMQLNRTPLYVAKHPVGIHPRMIKLESMLDLESNDVRMIGLWGQGGIGKTTLAKAIYNAIFRQFEGSCFLPNVQEASKDSNDLVTLQKKLLSQILLGKRLTVFSVDGGITLMQDRLCHKKVLLVLDDVNDVKQLNALVGKFEWFGKGSRIIITTRDSHLLTSHGIDKDHIYEVETLKDCEALELFNKHAFLRNNNVIIRRDLVDSALHYANGLPLALEVLGAFLCCRRESEWESALNRLAKSPDKTINDVLKLSYDGLEDYAKEIFLDIVYFFKGQSTEYIMKVLDNCDFDTTIGVQVLVEKSLIIKEKETLQMHDLIQLMGMDIVKQECLDDPGRRSRLWLYDDFLDVLSGDMGTNVVKAIVLDLTKPEEISIDPDAFANMRRLRVLIMINVHNSFKGPICLPNGLRWFEWPQCPPWFPKISSGQKKLVGLDLHKSNIQIVREQFKDFGKLKLINFSECQSVVCMPNLNCTPSLEELNLGGCKNLEHVHRSVVHHGKLQLLHLYGCSKLQRFPDIPDKVKALREILLTGTSIKELPTSIENLVSLEILVLQDCKKLEILPSSIYKLQNLKTLLLDGCSKLNKFPKKEEDSSDPHMEMGFPKLEWLDLRRCNLSEVEFLEDCSCFPFLRDLWLSKNNFTNLPTCGHLYNLLTLDVSYCRQLQEIRKIPGQLRGLEAVCCESLNKIPSDICRVRDIDLSLCHELVRKGFTNDLVKLEKFLPRMGCQVLLPGGHMPEWLLPDKDDYISFTTSKDLYKKFLGLAFCVVFRAKEGMDCAMFELLTYINGELRMKTPTDITAVDLDHVWLEYCEPKCLWGEDPFGPNDSSHFQFRIRATSAIVKKYGFRLICKPLENDLDILLQDDQLLDSALLYEIWYEDSQTSIEEESSSEMENTR